MASDSKKVEKSSSRTPSREEIFQKFQCLRNDQRNLTNKLSEFEADCNEHKVVISTLRNIDAERRCFRLIGGVLTERKVKDVLPTLMTNHEKLSDLVEKMKEQITKKGIEINEYKEKHQITIRGADKDEDHTSSSNPSDNTSGENRGNVLVS